MTEAEIKKHVMVTHSALFSKVCEPIFNATPINYIGCTRLYNDGARSLLCTNMLLAEELLRNHYHITGIEDAQIQAGSTTQEFFLWALSGFFSASEISKCFLKIFVDYNYRHGITLIERQNDYTEFFHICVDSNYKNPDEYLLNHLHKIGTFIFYIKSSLIENSALHKAYQKHHYRALGQSKKEIGSSPEPASELDSLVNRYYFNINNIPVYFTAREIECLILLYKNVSLKSQAKILNISLRTVEQHLENSKQKAKFHKQSDLLRYLQDNVLFKLIANKSPLVLHF